MQHIFPFSSYTVATWRSWSNYQLWIKNKIDSLQQYIALFNRDFCILNDTIQGYNGLSGKELNKSSTTDVWFPLSNVENSYVCFPGQLQWREGILSIYQNAYACLDERIVEKNDDNTYTLKMPLDRALLDNKLYYLPNSFIIFARKWLEGRQISQNEQAKSIDHYQIIAKPVAALYSVLSVANGLSFSCVENGQGVMGENLIFAWELLPNRYFFAQTETMAWGHNNTGFSQLSAYWMNNLSDAQKMIVNSLDQFWTGSYTLMHEHCLETHTSPTTIHREEFFFDESFEIKNRNIANHQVVEYIINTNLKEQEVDSDLWDHLQVILL